MSLVSYTFSPYFQTNHRVFRTFRWSTCATVLGVSISPSCLSPCCSIQLSKRHVATFFRTVLVLKKNHTFISRDFSRVFKQKYWANSFLKAGSRGSMSLSAGGSSLPIELLVEQVYEEVHVHFHLIEHFHHGHPFILHLK